MYDETIKSNSEGEQSMYVKFLEWLHIRQFIDRLGDNLDEMEDDDLSDKKE